MPHFKFESSRDFNLHESAAFARWLLQSDADSRNHVLSTFGLNLQLKKNPILTLHDGRKVGFGSFTVAEQTISFAISPKTGAIELDSILRALGKRLELQHIRLDNDIASLPTESGVHTFSFALLLKLITEIASAAVHLLNASVRKHEIVVQGGIRGRPLLLKSLHHKLEGKPYLFNCEVMDDASLSDYALVLRATAEDITNTLQKISPVFGFIVEDKLSTVRRISAQFGILSNHKVSKALLYKTTRPPFPFGLKDILYKCMRYWMWRGVYRVAEDGSVKFGYKGVVLDLDLIFQSYVGHAWNEALEGIGYRQLFRSGLKYTVGAKTHMLTPDHLFVNATNETLLVVDAKYSTKLGDEDHVYQMLSYALYQYPQTWNYNRKIGVLVYPGLTWNVLNVTGFEYPIYCVTLPVQEALYIPAIANFVSTLMTA